MMKFLAVLAFVALMPVAAMADANADATAAAQSWLALIDAGSYAQSWTAASTLFQGHITSDQWATAGKAARDPFGAVVTRTPDGVDTYNTIPGAPDGHYAIVYFDTKFANKAAAEEKVTVMQDGGAWKVAGYYVK